MMAWIAAIRFGLAIWQMARNERFKHDLVVKMRERLDDGEMSLNDWVSFGEDLGLK